MKKVILVGYMAVGKSTIAALLSDRTGVKAVDLDQLIEQQANMTISEIMEQKGEVYFRKLEHIIFKEMVSSAENLIISTGGGTPCYAENHLLLNGKNITSIYLKASIALLFVRLKAAKTERPLVAKKADDDLQEFIAKHLFERSFYYNQATFTLTVDAKSPTVIVEELLQLLH